MIRKTFFAVATVAAIGTAALIPTEASAGGGARVVAWVAITAIGAMATGAATAASWSSDPAAGDGCAASAEYMSATKSTSTVWVLAEAPVSRRKTGVIHLRNVRTSQR